MRFHGLGTIGGFTYFVKTQDLKGIDWNVNGAGELQELS